MSEVIKKEFKKSNIGAATDFDFYQIKRKSMFLLDCDIQKTADTVELTFTYHFEQAFEKIKKLPLAFRYQALINIHNLLTDAKRLKISLDPGNLTYDTNMMPKAIMRDVYTDTAFDEADFVGQYKALIGATLQNKYTFKDYYEGGDRLLNKHKMTLPYCEVRTLTELMEALNKEYAKMLANLQNNIMEVNKKKFKRMRACNRIFIIALLVLIGAFAYFGGYRLYEETAFKQANEAYIKQDYISVKENLEALGIDRMNTNTKYILAVSNVKVESLSDEQKDNILSGISWNADERIFDFWIYLGKSDMEQAIDVAKQLGNEEYLTYAYMKEKAFVESDTTLSGAEREEKLKEIEGNLEAIEIGEEENTK